jgi:hypothetical protein
LDLLFVSIFFIWDGLSDLANLEDSVVGISFQNLLGNDGGAIHLPSVEV